MNQTDLTPLQQAVVNASHKYAHVELPILLDVAQTAYAIGRLEATLPALPEWVKAVSEWSGRLARDAQALNIQCGQLIEMTHPPE
jgi:hypothetical protein